MDVKTTDGYVLRLFTVAFTAKTKGQAKKTAYAQSAQVRAIRKKMTEIITSTVSKSDLREFVAKHLYVQPPSTRGVSSLCCSFHGWRVAELDRELLSLWLGVRRLPQTIDKDITKACSSIFPLQNVNVRKVKMLKSPKFDREWPAVRVFRCAYRALICLTGRVCGAFATRGGALQS